MTSGKRIPELDGIRGVAILLVLVFHFGASTLPRGVIRDVATLGWSGVDLFFVLSGFLITGILLDTAGAPGYYRSFYARRMLRTFPLYFVYLAVMFFAILPAAKQFGFFVKGGFETLPYWLYLSNWTSPFENSLGGPFSHLWSLAVEEQFYLFWPLVVRYASPRALPLVCVALAIASFAFRNLWPVDPLFPEVVYRWTPARIEPIALGALVACAARKPQWVTRVRIVAFYGAAVASAMLGATIAACDSTANLCPAMYRYGYTALAVLYALAVLHAAARGSRVLRSPLLGLFGKYSYGIYVIHFPVALAAIKLREIYGERMGVAFSLLSLAIGVTLSLAAAALSWRFLESPFLRLKCRFTPSSIAQP